MSGRDRFGVAQPTKIGAPPLSGTAHTCTASTPEPDGPAPSIAQPETTNDPGTWLPSAGASIAIASGVVTVITRGTPVNCPVTVLRANTTTEYVPAANPETLRWYPDAANGAP